MANFFLILVFLQRILYWAVSNPQSSMMDLEYFTETSTLSTSSCESPSGYITLSSLTLSNPHKLFAICLIVLLDRPMKCFVYHFVWIPLYPGRSEVFDTMEDSLELGS